MQPFYYGSPGPLCSPCIATDRPGKWPTGKWSRGNSFAVLKGTRESLSICFPMPTELPCMRL